MKFMKKNQVVIYVIALMLVVAGYLNFTADGDFKSAVQTASSEEELDKMANIGDAQLVSSNVVSDDLDTSNTISKSDISESESLETTSKDIQKNNDDYFSTSKLERDTMYSQMLETYEKVLNSTNSLETQKQSATQEITKINETKNSIMVSENLLQSKGFENSVIFVNGNSISVIIGASELKKEEVAQIQNIIAREMKASIENIHISTK